MTEFSPKYTILACFTPSEYHKITVNVNVKVGLATPTPFIMLLVFEANL